MSDASAAERRPTDDHARHGDLLRGVAMLAGRTAAVLAVLVLAPVLLALAILVARTSSGKILVRDGADGRLRFRTVLDGSATDVHSRLRAVVGQADATPLTPPGAWMRRTRLDRLAHLLDVAAGSASRPR